MKRIQVEIMERSYVLACPEGCEERFNEAVRRVDSAMRAIRDAGKIKARDRIAVLAALNLAFEDTAPGTAAAPASAIAQAANPAASAPADESAALQTLLQNLDGALDTR